MRSGRRFPKEHRVNPTQTAAAPPPPKLENSTLRIERFIALAISRVSRMPAAPTIMPAMISASLPST